VCDEIGGLGSKSGIDGRDFLDPMTSAFIGKMDSVSRTHINHQHAVFVSRDHSDCTQAERKVLLCIGK
jgi:hypothetical protein